MSERDWKRFVLEHGAGALATDLAAVLGVGVEDIRRFRAGSAIDRQIKRVGYAELFSTWHGRPPGDEEWPSPKRAGHGAYAWQGPEYALVARLTGQVGTKEIARLLTDRLRRITGDPNAERTVVGLNVARQRLGITTADVIGGVTVAAAAREIGISSILYNDIRLGRLKARRVGRHLVIDHQEFQRWKQARVFPPKGYVQLTTLKVPLGIRSDKLSEWARAGRIPTAIRCNPYGARSHSTQFGTWWIDKRVQRKLIADRRAGRPMPWHGGFDEHNLKVTFALWRKRQHPARCQECGQIWGAQGPPRTFDEYSRRYPPLAHGAKRHLTKPWSDGLLPIDVARRAGVPPHRVLQAMGSGALRSMRHAGRRYVSKTDAARWIARKMPTGANQKSWMSIASACREYAFTRRELRRHIDTGRVNAKTGDFGAQRGVRLVLRQHVRELRDEIGFNEAEAARRAKVSVPRLRILLRGLEWRDADHIPAAVVHNVIKRQQSAAGVSIAEAARRLRRTVAWVEREITLGTVRVSRAKWHKRRRYLTMPMFRRLERAAAAGGTTRIRWSADWLLVSDAALLAGVSATQVQRWSDNGDVKIRMNHRLRRYHKQSVQARARKYWRSEVRWRRRNPPAWFVAEEHASLRRTA